MPESEKLHQNQPGENWDSEIAQREMILRNGQKTNEAEMKMKSLWEHYADLAKEKKLMEELLALEEQDSEAQPETDLAEKNDTVAEASLPMDEVEKATLLEKIKDKARKSKGFNTVMAGVMAVAMLFSTHVRASAPDINSPAARSESMQMYSNIDQIKDQITIPDVLLDNPDFVLHENSDSSATESEPGIKNGYGEKGMWLSENKSGRFSFGNAAEVAEVCNNDPKEMMYYTISNMPEAFASYISFTPDEYRREDFRGLSDAEIEKKIEGLSGPEYQDLLEHYRKNVLDASVFEDDVLNGRYRTHYISYLGEGNTDATHENMGLFRCNVNRNHQKASAFRLPNGKSILVNMSAIRDEQGKITGFRPEGCLQPQGVIAVAYDGKRDEFQVTSYDQSQDNYEVVIIPANIAEAPIENQTEISAKESEGPSGDLVKESIGPSGEESIEEPTGPTGGEPGRTGGGGGGHHTKRWGKEGDPHGGPDVTPSDLVDPNSEITKEENDKINKGNQGYVDDNKATPGSSSESNGVDQNTGFAKSGITASGATTSEGRLRGGSNQAATASGESRMAGENAYQSNAATERGREVDNSGNNAQAAAQSAVINNSTSNLGGTNAGANAGSTTSAAGRDNNSNAAEERAVANGDF